MVPHGQAQSMFPFCRGLCFYGWPLEGSFFGASARLGAPSPPPWAALFLAGPWGCFVLFSFFFLVGVFLGIAEESLWSCHICSSHTLAISVRSVCRQSRRPRKRPFDNLPNSFRQGFARSTPPVCRAFGQSTPAHFAEPCGQHNPPPKQKFGRGSGASAPVRLET